MLFSTAKLCKYSISATSPSRLIQTLIFRLDGLIQNFLINLLRMMNVDRDAGWVKMSLLSDCQSIVSDEIDENAAWINVCLSYVCGLLWCVVVIVVCFRCSMWFVFVNKRRSSSQGFPFRSLLQKFAAHLSGIFISMLSFSAFDFEAFFCSTSLAFSVTKLGLLLPLFTRLFQKLVSRFHSQPMMHHLYFTSIPSRKFPHHSV